MNAVASASQVAIFGRLINPAEVPPQVARFLLALGFDEQDKARMHELAVRNQESALSSAEQQELQNYVKVGQLLTMLHSRARMSLKKKKVS